MIKIDLGIRESLTMIANGCSHDMFEKIVTALEVALNVSQSKMVTITGGITLDNRISCIKAIRLHAGWGLKEAKDWTDTLVGGWKYDKFVPASADVRQSITLKTPEAAENLLRDLTSLGCEGYLS